MQTIVARGTRNDVKGVKKQLLEV